jgi:hypothetical protein
MGRDKLIKAALMERFAFTLDTGETFEGLLRAADEKTIHVVDAYVIGDRSRREVDGALFLPRARLSYMQRLGAK